MKKILFTATVDSHILNFHIPYLNWFKTQGYEVHVASNGDSVIPFADMKHNLPFERSPAKKANFSAYKQLKRIIDDNNYELIHCNTPMGSVITRLAARDARKKGTKVLYTAHGFHFYNGAPLINWILYYPVEKWLSRFTDCLITINEEDYEKVITNKFKSGSIKKVNGVGVDLNKFHPQTLEEKNELRQTYGYRENDFILFYAAELSYRKHQDLLISSVSMLINDIPNIKLLLAGSGSMLDTYREQANQLGINNNIDFLGYRKDVRELLKLSDIYVSSSRQEGLPVNVMEAMATGLPLVVTDCRGNRDLVTDGVNGFVVGIDDVEGFASAISKLYKSEKLRNSFSMENFEQIKIYSLDNIMKEMSKIYISHKNDRSVLTQVGKAD